MGTLDDYKGILNIKKGKLAAQLNIKYQPTYKMKDTF